MGFCSNCGAQVNDEAAYCMNCGAALSTQSSAPSMSTTGSWGQTQQTSGAWSQPPQYQPTYSVQPSSPAIGVLKRIAASPLFLVTVILVSFTLLMQLIGVFVELGNIGRYGYYGMGELGAVTILINILSLVLPTLTVVGLWLAFAAGMNKRTGGFSTTGLTMIKVVYIIKLVFECIFYGIIAISMIVTLVGTISAATRYSSYGYGSTVGGTIGAVLLITMLLVAAFIVFRIIWYVKINQSINAAKYTAYSGNGVAGASTYVGVFCFIGAAVSLIALVLGTAVIGAMYELLYEITGSHEIARMAGSLSSSGALGIITSLCSIATSIMFGIIIFMYRGRMTNLSTSPMAINTGLGSPNSGFAPQSGLINTMNTTTTSETPYVSSMDNTGSFSNWDNTNS